MPRIIKYFIFSYFLIALFFITHHVISQDNPGKIDALVNQYYELGQFNGAVLVAENGNIIYSKGVGYADVENKIPNKPDTKFRLASVTKQFTSMLIMQLAEKGKINLDSKLSDYLPYYRKDVGEKITIKQILSHTSGLTNYTDSRKFMQDEVKIKADPKEFVLKYCSDDLATEPGTNWAYSNSGYFILGLVIEEVTGKKYAEVLQENILDPLGMKNSGVEVTGNVYENYAKGYQNLVGEYKPARPIEMTVPYSAGSMYSTVEDMLKWDQALYTDKLLSEPMKNVMFTPVMNNYALGWQVIEQPLGEKKVKVITHSGGIFGFNSLITRLVEDNRFVMVLNNFEGGNINQLTLGIVNILYGYEPAKPKKSAAIELAVLIGTKGIDVAVNEFLKIKDNKDEYIVREREINQLGYNLLLDGKTAESVKVFKLNAELYPESWNVYDSFAEALAAAGDTENAIMNYRKSIELNPENDGGKEMLKRLEEKNNKK